MVVAPRWPSPTYQRISLHSIREVRRAASGFPRNHSSSPSWREGPPPAEGGAAALRDLEKILCLLRSQPQGLWVWAYTAPGGPRRGRPGEVRN